MNIALIISALCSVNSGEAGYYVAAKAQLKCQKYYVKCMVDQNDKRSNNIKILKCIEDKK